MGGVAGSNPWRWVRQLGPRWRAYWLVKHLAIGTLMTAFFAGYFALQAHPLFPVTVMPLTALDRLIGFHPAALVFYASLWLYVPIVPAFSGDRRELVGYALSVVGLGVLGLSIFFVWPTSTPPPEVDWARFPAFGFLREIDKAGNACPSLHVTFAIFTGVTADRLFRQLGAGWGMRTLNGLWCFGIVYSTLATKQHVAVDLFAGVALGAGWSCLHLKLVPESGEQPEPRTAVLRADRIV